MSESIYAVICMECGGAAIPNITCEHDKPSKEMEVVPREVYDTVVEENRTLRGSVNRLYDGVKAANGENRADALLYGEDIE